MKLYKHHIVPKCLGGLDDPSNLVNLTYEQHIEAHKILCEQNPKHFGLRYAYLNMINLSEQAHKEACSLGGKRSAISGGCRKGGLKGGPIGGLLTGTKNLRNWAKNNPETVAKIASKNGCKSSKKIFCVESNEIFNSVNDAMRKLKSSNIARALKKNIKVNGLTLKYIYE